MLAYSGYLVGDPDQRRERDQRVLILPGGIRLEDLKIDAQRRPLGAGAGQPVHDPGTAFEQNPDALVFALRSSPTTSAH